MRRGILLLVLLTLSAVVGGVGGGTFAPATAADGAGTTDTQRVIVTLRTPHPNETGLGLQARAAQRLTIASATDEVDGIVHDQGGRVVHRFHSVPYVAVEANEATIARLRQAPDVAAVVPDTPIPAADAESTPLVGATATQAGGVDGQRAGDRHPRHGHRQDASLPRGEGRRRGVLRGDDDVPEW